MAHDVVCSESNLTSLPLDILISLMDYLHPLDLITLRKTCRALYDASRQRIVWIKALVDVCITNDIFLPTFPLDQMTTEELTQAATTPSRWLTSVRRRCRHHASDGAVLEPSGINPKPIKLGLSPNDEVQGVFLVPGGRFVLILTLHSLQLRDLAWGGADPRIGQLVAAMEMNQQYNITFSVQPTRDGMGLRIVVPSYPMDTAANRRKQITIYEIFPLEDEPRLNEIALLNIDSTAPTIAPRLAGDLLLFLDGTVIKVWDFINGLWAEWNTQKNFLKTVFVTSDSVFLLNHEETIVWRIPELKPIDQPSVPTPTENVFPFPSILGSGNTKMCHHGAMGDWHWGKQEPSLDIFCKASPCGSASTMTRYKLVPPLPSPSPDSNLLAGPSQIFHNTLASDLGISNTTLEYRYCEGDLVACSISKDAVLGYISISGKDPEAFAHVAMKLKHDMSSIMDYSVCPLAGKVCYVTDENEVELVDLFHGMY